MANKTFRRVLSIIICAAMLVSVFAVSFTASAANETVYNWDYENDDEALTKTQSNSVVISDKDGGSIGVTDGYLKINRTGGNGKATAVYFNTPENTTPQTFTVTSSQAYVDGNDKDCAAGALIAKYKYKNEEWAVSFCAYTGLYGSENPILKVGLRKFEEYWDDDNPKLYGCLKYGSTAVDGFKRAIFKDENGNPVAVNSSSTTNGKGTYANDAVWGEKGNSTNIPTDKMGNFKYTYHITYKEDSVEVFVIAKYSTDESEELTAQTVTYTVSYNELLTALINGNREISDLTWMCGLTSTAPNSGSLTTAISPKIYNVRATYAPESSTVEPEITASANVVLDEGIKLKITAEGNEGIQADTLKLTVDGEEKELTNGAAIIPKFAHQMADKMKIVITADDVNGNTITKTIGDDESGYSIADNLANTYNQLNAEKDAATKKLIAKLANYGAAAQQYDALANNIEYTQLANYFLDDADKTPDAEAYNTMESVLKGTFVKEDSDVFTTGLKASLAIGLQENIKMIIRVSGINLGDNQNLYVKMDGTDYPLTEKNGVYTGQFGEFKPKEYADSKTITLVVKSNDTETSAEEEVSGEVTYSVGTYINRMASKSSDGLKLLLNAITEYSTAYAEVYNALTNA